MSPPAAGFNAVYLLGSDEGPPVVADVSLYQLFGCSSPSACCT